MGLFGKLFGQRKDAPEAPAVKHRVVQFEVPQDLYSEDLFWQVIERSLQCSSGDFDRQQECLARELQTMSPEDLIRFENRFAHFRGEANTWELWGAIYLIRGGCGDDSFHDFREWVIGQGKLFYHKTISDPSSLVELDPRYFDVDWEGLGYVPLSVFKDLTGVDMPYSFPENTETRGEEWSEEGEDLQRMFPALAAKYGG